ncbi:MAG TPA: gluconate 2-dehydrogenase subunit 3 family protein [Sphingobacteriaceae bacterium]
MDRRESLKLLAVGSLAAGTMLAPACTDDKKSAARAPAGEGYGRTPEEEERDRELMNETFFTKEEMATITVLSDIIIPADDRSGSASQAGVPEFIEFIVKDQPSYQTPLRGGLRWMDMRSVRNYGKPFAACSNEQQLELVDRIAYPQKQDPEMSQGVSFFKTMRNLVATGFFTSKMGIEDLRYQGNRPNAWDGVPDDVLKQYGLEYDEKTLSQCLKPEDRGKIMTWES